MNAPVQRHSLMDNSAGSTFTLSPSANITVGEVAILVIDAEDAHVTAVSDNAGGNTWSKIGANPGAQSGVFLSVWWCKVATQISTTTVITVTRPTFDRPVEWTLYAVSGWTGTPTLDTSPSNANGTAASMTAGTTGVPQAASSLAFVAWGTSSATNPSSITPDAPYTKLTEQGNTLGGIGRVHICSAYNILSSASAQSPTSTAAGQSTPFRWQGIAFTISDVSGGTANTISLAGAVTPSGNVVRQGALRLSGGVNPSGTISKSVSVRLSGLIVPSGSLTRATAKGLSGSITPSGSLTVQRVTLVSLSGSIAPIGSLVRQTGKSLGGGLTPAGFIVKAVSSSLSGVVSPLSGSLRLSTGKTLSGGVTPTGALTKTIGKALVGLMTPTGSVMKSVGKMLTGTIIPTGVVVKAVLASYSGIIIPTGTLAKRIAKAFNGSVTPIGSLQTFFQSGLGTSFFISLTGTVAPSGRISLRAGKNLGGLLRLFGRGRTHAYEAGTTESYGAGTAGSYSGTAGGTYTGGTSGTYSGTNDFTYGG